MSPNTAPSFSTRSLLLNQHSSHDRLPAAVTATATATATATVVSAAAAAAATTTTTTTTTDSNQVKPQQTPYFPGQTGYLSHLPPPYLPLEYSVVYPTTATSTGSAGAAQPAYAESLSKISSEPLPTHPSVMVYPPPPPPPANGELRQSPHHHEERGPLPSMGSWAPPPLLPSPQSSTMSKQEYWRDRPREFDMKPSPSRERKRSQASISTRRPSNAEEEAGLALAGMGMGLTPGQVKAEITGNKRVKVEEKPKKEGAKEGKKSCSECRRLKAKCDRVFPCSNCRRRGCALVCPDGDLSCMQGKRLVLASTEQLHERIAQLESALVKAHSSNHSGPHPLLAAEYLDGGFASMPTPPGQSHLQHSHSPPSLADGHLQSPKDRYSDSSFTLATPHLSADRASSQGRMAVESLLLTDDQAAPEGKREDDWVGENAAPALIVGTVDRAPSEERSDERRAIFERLRSILRVVPPRDVTRRKAEHFWQTSTWYGNILRKEEFDSIYEPAVYAPTPSNPITPHKLACVLMLLALHTYFDLEANEDDPAIAEYWEGAQMCFDTRFGWASSVAGVQALGLATLFVGFGWRGAKATNFYWLRQMTTAVQALGLHKDPHPSLPEEEREFRRRVFHESYCIDCLISINHGQRTGVQLENIEAAMPNEQRPLLRIKYEYMQNVKAVVIDIGCRPDSSPASWELVNQTDARLMKSDAKAFPHMHCPGLNSVPPPMTNDPKRLDFAEMTRCTTSMCHYKALLYLYRPSLRRLISRLRTEPRESITLTPEEHQTVSRTFMACHAITATSLYMARTHPVLSARCWAVWVQTFSAAVSMAALAIWCGPFLENTFVNSAYQELVDAGEMIKESGSRRSQGIVSLMPVLRSLVSGRYPQVIGGSPMSVKISQEGEDMLFALLGGQVDQRVPAPMLAEPMPLAFNAQYPTDAHAPSSHYSYFEPLNPWSHDMMQQQQQQQQQQSHGYQQQYQQLQQPQQQQQQYQSMNQSPNFGNDGRIEDMSATELWARLQTFYEPTPAFWDQNGMMMPGGGGAGVGVGQQNVGGGDNASNMWMNGVGVGGVMT